MLNKLHSPRVAVAVLAGILLLAALVLALAPEEKSLGQGIKVVYVHVALTWTGLTGILLLGLLGLGVLVTGRAAWLKWAQSAGWAALILFGGGFAMSMWAARINWGAVFWDEPRTRMAGNIIALTLIVLLLNAWRTPVRLRGLLALVPAIFTLYWVATTRLVLHPQSPILTSDSRAIQFTFFGLFALFSLAALWSVWQWRRGARVEMPA
jgi:hypothetical protein